MPEFSNRCTVNCVGLLGPNKVNEMEKSMLRRSFIAMSLVLALSVSGCAVFTSHFDATRLENFTSLKAIHMKLFDNWTLGSEKPWRESEVNQYCEHGDLKFREAYEFSKSQDRKDKTGQTAVKLLWDEFSANCQLSLKKKKPFSAAYVNEVKPQIEKNYEYAIAGELARVNAPQ